MTFTFDTADYPNGYYNLTVKGYTQMGVEFQAVESVEFLDPSINIWLVLGIVVILTVSIYFKLRKYRARPITPKTIKIDEL